jgi:hypothetical protein
VRCLQVLSLPIHEFCGEKHVFGEVEEHKLPPPGAVSSLLTPAFLKATAEEAEVLNFLALLVQKYKY